MIPPKNWKKIKKKEKSFRAFSLQVAIFSPRNCNRHGRIRRRWRHRPLTGTRLPLYVNALIIIETRRHRDRHSIRGKRGECRLPCPEESTCPCPVTPNRSNPPFPLPSASFSLSLSLWVNSQLWESRNESKVRWRVDGLNISPTLCRCSSCHCSLRLSALSLSIRTTTRWVNSGRVTDALSL